MAAPLRTRNLIPAGVREQFVEIRGRRMRYLTAGSGPPLIFIAGLLGFSFSWTENLSFFAEHFTIYAPDLFGTGYSDPPPASECSLESVARSIAEFMDAMQIDRASLVGSSHGATLILLLAALFPDRVDRLVTCAPPHPWSNEAKRFSVHLFSSALGPLLSTAAHLVPPPLRRVALYDVYAHPARALPGTIETYADALLQKPVLEHVLQVLRCWKHDFGALAEQIEKVRCPVLLLWGDHDRVIPLRTAAELQTHLERAELCVIPDCGHLPYEELPQEFNRRVLDWLLRPSVLRSPVGLC